MKKRKLKRTAGQRRFLALVKQVQQARKTLDDLIYQMHQADSTGKTLRQLHIMQKITETKELLRMLAL